VNRSTFCWSIDFRNMTGENGIPFESPSKEGLTQPADDTSNTQISDDAKGTDNSFLKNADILPGNVEDVSRSPSSHKPGKLQTQNQAQQHQTKTQETSARKPHRRTISKLSGQPISLLSVGSIDDIERLDVSDRSVGNISRKLQRSSLGNMSEKKMRVTHPTVAASTSELNNSMHNIKSAQETVPSSTPHASKIPKSAFEHPKIPKMKDPSRCNLFCAFYAEFDNIVGPQVKFQAPEYFMDNDIAITSKEVEEILAKSFRCSNNYCPENDDENLKTNCDAASANNGDQGKDAMDDEAAHDEANQHHCSSRDSTFSSQMQQPDAVQKPTVPQHSQSIFDSTCEYIITGNELTGHFISLSTHNVHIITRPTIIQDTHYERNSLLFSVGFVIRRLADPFPYRPLLSRLASVLRSMEIESRFLSSPSTKPRIQDFLNSIVPSLNSAGAKCHLLLDEANALHLQYFPPPKLHAPPVPKFVVPVLLRPEDMLQSLDWDLTINWIVPHINGIKHAKLIADTSKVDEAMVLSCLRVLRHHNVLACVDIFRYSNIYESTPKAQQMLAGNLDGLLSEAVQFVSKQTPIANQSSQVSASVAGTPVGSFGNVSVRRGNTMNGGGTMTLLAPISTPSSYSPIPSASLDRMDSDRPAGASISSSNTPGREIYTCSTNSPPRVGERSTSQVASPFSASVQAFQYPSHIMREQKSRMTSLAILFSSCQRGVTVGEVFTNRVKNNDGPNMQENSNGTTNGLGSKTSKKKKRKSKVRSSSMGSSNSSAGDIDWKEVFNYFDHRRFVTFGVIHGLIRRVHEFPIAVKSKTRKGASTTVNPSSLDKAEQSNIESHKRNTLRRHKSLGLEKFEGTPDPPTPFQIPYAPTKILHGLSTDSSNGSVVHVQNKEDSAQRHSTQSITSVVTPISSHAMHGLSKKIASAMDGSRCDDELSCMFQKSINELRDLVKKYGNNEVISLYSTEI